MNRSCQRSTRCGRRVLVLDSFEVAAWTMAVEVSEELAATTRSSGRPASGALISALRSSKPGGRGMRREPGQASRRITIDSNLAMTGDFQIERRVEWAGSSSERRSGGFTLVELLTVMAIIAVLATLLMTALASAKRKTRQVACTSHLRQISLALNMYIDDQEKRPEDLTVLVSSKYLPAAAVLRCPEDKTGNWGGLVESSQTPEPPPMALVSAPAFAAGSELSPPKTAAPAAETDLTTPAGIPYSYLHPLPWEKWAWDRLNGLAAGAGIAACQWHGMGKPNLDWPRIQDFEGLVLRAQRDGAVVRRQVYWDRPQEGSRLMLDAAAMVSTSSYPWRLFTDEAEP